MDITRRESREIGDFSTDFDIPAMFHAAHQRIAPALALSPSISYYYPLSIRAIALVQTTFFALLISYSGSR
ncbi:MAG TPA: hypothetical protein VF514_15795 [Bacteroidota bacterium]